jgi:predicted dehydrogenase
MASHLSRRRFLEDSLLATTAALAAGPIASVLAKDDAQDAPRSPNETLSVCVIGVNGRGSSHLAGFGDRNGAKVTHICDCDENVGERQVAAYAKKHGHRPKWVRDMREVFDDKSVDVVSIATPNHWHSLAAIWALQAGKDVYVEKPVSHNVSEGRRIVEAARKYKRVCQTGTQCRSMPAAIEAIQYVHDGKLGDLQIARGLCYKKRGSIGPKGDYPVPATVDYDLWCGPATMDKVTRPKFHYDWHWIWNYGNGDLGNQGIHQMDVARWGVGSKQLPNAVYSYGGRVGYEDAGETANTQVVALDYGNAALIFEVRGLKTDPYRGAMVGNIFHCKDGYVALTGYNSGAAFDLDGKLIKQFTAGAKEGNIHFDNFLDAVRSRDPGKLNADIEEGHLSSAMCHLGNISYRLGSQMPLGEIKDRLKGEAASETYNRFAEHLHSNDVPDSTELSFGATLKIDPKAEKFIDNSTADAMLTREYRKPYIVPAAGQV